MLSGRGLCDGPITRPEESYRLWCVIVCDLENLSNQKAKTPQRVVMPIQINGAVINFKSVINLPLRPFRRYSYYSWHPVFSYGQYYHRQNFIFDISHIYPVVRVSTRTKQKPEFVDSVSIIL